MPGTHRLAAKIEETVLNNGVWDKIIVKIPNPSYILTEVKHENNKLSILFEYNDEAYEPMNFAFMLSAFSIDPNSVAEDDDFLVVGCDAGSSVNEKAGATDIFPGWFGSNGYMGSYVLTEQQNTYKVANNRCPTNCGF